MQNKTNLQTQLSNHLLVLWLKLAFSFCLFLIQFPCTPSPWQACSKVCAYVSRQVEHVRKSMDGKNVDTVLTELGVRFHRLIHEHLQQYSYSSMGGMLAICDVAEYRRCAKDFRVRGGHRSRIYWSQGKAWLCLQRLCQWVFIIK